MGMGIGAAMTGLRVIIEGMNMGFLLLAYNQISNNAGMLHYTSGGQYKVRYVLCFYNSFIIILQAGGIIVASCSNPPCHVTA